MTTLFALPGGPEMLVIFFAIVLLFGGKGIPKLMKGLGQGIGEFKKARKELEDSLNEGVKDVKRLTE